MSRALWSQALTKLAHLPLLPVVEKFLTLCPLLEEPDLGCTAFPLCTYSILNYGMLLYQALGIFEEDSFKQTTPDTYPADNAGCPLLAALGPAWIARPRAHRFWWSPEVFARTGDR